jgi:hypothetical protein
MIGLSIVSFSCGGYIILKKKNIGGYNKVFVGTIINEQKNESGKYIQNLGAKKITIKIDELFITDTTINDTIELTVRDNGYFKKKDKWLFILADNYTTYCMSLWMNAKDKVHSNQSNTEAFEKNLKFLREYTNKK